MYFFIFCLLLFFFFSYNLDRIALEKTSEYRQRLTRFDRTNSIEINSVRFVTIDEEISRVYCNNNYRN